MNFSFLFFFLFTTRNDDKGEKSFGSIFNRDLEHCSLKKRRVVRGRISPIKHRGKTEGRGEKERGEGRGRQGRRMDHAEAGACKSRT